MSNIKKIKIGQNEYGITASEIGNLEHLEITTTSTGDAPELTITSGATSNPADIKLTCASTASVSEGGKVNGVIALNTKGNLAVESLSKHLNLESAKGIQLKPTTTIIVDTSRRASQEGGENEAIIDIKYDDLPGDDDTVKRGYLKMYTRAIDLRCYDHGGIALQPCGTDSDGNENKIKFESSRIVSANDTANPTTDYVKEGGKGVEFGSFNNEHTSIFTKDYRFNKDGKVYSVGRATVTVSGTKKDYPTQGDDFKDIPVSNKGNNCTYNTSTHQWEAPSGEYIMGASWDSIVKTSNALNEQPWAKTNVSGSNNIQIVVENEYFWQITSPEAPEVPVSRQLDHDTTTPPTAEQYTTSQAPGCNGIWKLNDGLYYTITQSGSDYSWESSSAPTDVDTDHDLGMNPETKWKYANSGDVYKVNNHYSKCIATKHNLNLESDNKIKISGKHNDVEIISEDGDIVLTVGDDTVSVKDIITLVNYMKTTNPSGPWASTGSTTPWTVPGA